MGRHSQSSSLGTTLVGLGELAYKSLSTASSAHGRRRASGPAKTSLSPMMYRAGGAAAVVSLAVSGGAYAATQISDDGVPVGEGMRTELDAADYSAQAPAQGLTVSGETATVTTEVVDATEAHATTEQEDPSLPKGEKKVVTEGVDGVTRTTYQVTWAGDREVSREVVATVEVTPKVDEVVHVGSSEAPAEAEAPAAAAEPAAPAPEAAPEAAPSAPQTTAPSGDPQAIAHSMLGSYGWDEGEFSCLVSLWNRESGWNSQAQNPSSGAYGIPQALPGSKMASAGADWQTNPATQIRWGLGYISERYGSPCGAWAHSESTGWY